MFANTWRSRVERRGIVLVVILGMLGLMALIGVTFATFAGQTLINNRNYAQSVNLPSPEQLMDYALSQLINDTNNPMSSLRGHSLLRDMYGNDSMIGNAAGIRGYLDRRPDGLSLTFINSGAFPNLSASTPSPGINLAGYVQYETNIPVNSPWPQLYGVDFTRWILRTLPQTVTDQITGVSSLYPSQTLEILHDDISVNGNHVLTLAGADSVTRNYHSPNLQYMYGVPPANSTTGPAKPPVYTTQPIGSQFVLDCRYMRAQNGPGMSQPNPAGLPDLSWLGAGQPHNSAAYANFRTNGDLLAFPFVASANFNNTFVNLSKGQPNVGDPDQIAMDEDYDACDLENWFLAIQSADGQVMIPSFHRPGILTAADWTASLDGALVTERQRAIMAVSKILRPRAIDNASGFPSDPSMPDPITGQIKYDVDNDGDGVSDSVWLDLGYPLMKDSRGKTFKPLFAFMVLGLNGRLPLNTVGNLHGRDMTSGGDLPIYSGPDKSGTVLLSYPDRPTWTHASHLGYSVNEINPIFALQNACDAVTTNNNPAPPQGTGPFPPGAWLSQADNSRLNLGLPGSDVATTQLRNILAGTVPQSKLIPPAAQGINYADPTNAEHNYVLVQGSPYFMPNNLFDEFEQAQGKVSVGRNNTPVPGRFGEPEGISKVLIAPTTTGHTAKSSAVNNPPGLLLHRLEAYENPVRAGRSFLNSSGLSTDAFDDDNDTTDFLAPPPMGVTNDNNILAYTASPASNNERWNYYDSTGSLILPVERIRRFVSPIDPVGIGRVVPWNKRPSSGLDYDNGYDNLGRVGTFRYFRPPGLPQTVGYDTDPSHNTPAALPTNERYNIPILTYPSRPDVTSNLYNGFWSRMFPTTGVGGGGAAGVAVSGSTPFDYDTGTNQMFAPYGAGSTNMPVPVPYKAVPSAFPSMSTGINSFQGPYLGPGVASPNLGAQVINGYPNYPPLLPSNANVANAGASLNKDEADEMNLYTSSGTTDMPYGPSDLEWLYRKNDVDGAQLDSRLAKLAPISFLNPVDGAMRRRLFSVDVWDTINSTYAFDNPNNAHAWNSRFAFYTPNGSILPLPSVPGSSLVAQTAIVAQTPNLFAITQIPNPSLFGPIVSTPNNLSIPQNTAPNGRDTAPLFAAQQLPMDASTLSTYVGANGYRPVLTPPIAHRDRKINLNFPLPVSNDPGEPVRQKWARETYQLLKAILPPQAIDTPQELAQLSQFVVNMIDFRDPDCSMTRFVNTDLQVVPPTATNPAGLIFAIDPVPDANNAESAKHFPFDPLIFENATYRTTLDATPNHGQFLVQHGMEYNPVAINEVLAYSYQARKGVDAAAVGNPTHRFFMELVNTLTDDGTGSSASDLNLKGWDVVITPDNAGGTDVTGRPDPITGEVSPLALTKPGFAAHWALSLATKIKAIATGGATYYIVGTKPATTDADNPDPTGTNLVTLPAALSSNPFPTAHTLAPKSGKSQFMWVYLRRPANPFDANHSPSEMVTVDSFRFHYSEVGGEPAWDSKPTVQNFSVSGPGSAGKRSIYSTQRFQPYRGGQLIPKLPAGADPVPSTAWGFTEQTKPASTKTMSLVWKATDTMKTPPVFTASTAIKHSLGEKGAVADSEGWDYFVFNDRDYMSPAEILLVPGTAPGLFTKQFIEQPFGIAAKGGGWLDSNLSPDAATPSGSNIGAVLNTGTPSVFPYLPDNFYYSAASVAPYPGVQPTDPYPSKLGGWTGAGWYKMLEFLEVPSSANGAIGPVADGWNFDWARQDRKPGQINLNLIIDEEVFFGVLDDPRLNALVMGLESATALPRVVSQIDTFGYPVYRSVPEPLAIDQNFLGAYPMSGLMTYQVYDPGGANPLLYDATNPYVVGPPLANGRGFAVQRVLNGKTYYTQGMKTAFADFLKLRHGGSGFLFAWGSGITGQGSFSLNQPISPATTVPVAAERPFRSLSNPNINTTVMRPATLPPSPLTIPFSPPDSWLTTDVNGVNPTPAYPLTPPEQSVYSATYPGGSYQYADINGNMYAPPNGANAGKAPSEFVMDPGLKNPYLDTTAMNPTLVPVIPPRRLFTIPDKESAGVPPTVPPSNAAAFDDPTAAAKINQPVNSRYNDYQGVVMQGLSTFAPSLVHNTALGTNDPTILTNLPTPPPTTWQLGHAAATGDQRQHPYFRTEWLQKVLNLTTVKTHQFAVWVTIGFFEVVQPGAPSLAVPDKLGTELGAASGRNIRYRSFFVLDRTRAVGFSSTNPVDFRDVVTYRRRIE